MDLREILTHLVRFQSRSSSRVDNNACLAWIEQQIPGCWQQEYFEHDGYRSLIVSNTGKKKAKLVLNGHVDVVDAREDQFEIRESEGSLWGRGTYDMKGSIAVYLKLLQELPKDPRFEDLDLQVQFVSDEEIGGHRGTELLAPAGYIGDFVIVGEPTDLHICHQAKGVYWLEVSIPGTPGHAARPWLCNNPLDALSQGLVQLQKDFPKPSASSWVTTCTPTFVSGGSSHNRVPDAVTVKLDMRFTPDYTPEKLHEKVQAAFPAGTITVIQNSIAHDTAGDNVYVQRLVDLLARDFDFKAELFQEHFASDARHFTHDNIPSVCWGPPGAGMHADDERLELKGWETYSQMLMAAVWEFGFKGQR